MKFSFIHAFIAVLLFLIIGFLGGLWLIEPRTHTPIDRYQLSDP